MVTKFTACQYPTFIRLESVFVSSATLQSAKLGLHPLRFLSGPVSCVHEGCHSLTKATRILCVKASDMGAIEIKNGA